jgi:phage-related baseplate assembly protein
VLAAVIEPPPQDQHTRLETLLRLVEETVPVQRIWVDTAENQDGVAGPFEGEQSNKLRDHIRIAYEALLERGDELSVAWEKIQNFPAFQGHDAAAIIAVLMEEGE